MTLLRALILMFSSLLILIMGATFLVSVRNSQEFLKEQLASHAQDTATYLGLSLSSFIKKNNTAAVDSMINAVFDRGYYREILILSIEGQTFVKRVLPIKVSDVPSWFIRHVPLSIPDGESIIMSGWKQTGRVVVRSHPGYAYAELWNNFTDIFWCYLIAWFVGTILIVLLLRALLFHLRALEVQAVAIGEREFPILEKMPWARELRSVAIAMNRMSEKLKTSFRDHAEFIESLHEKAYKDPVTHLSNRQNFESRLRFFLESPDEFSHGALMLIHIADFNQFNQEHGRKMGDDLLRNAAQCIQNVCSQKDSGNFVARMNGAEFAVIAKASGIRSAENLAEMILGEVGHLHKKYDLKMPLTFHCGISLYTGHEKLDQLFAAADVALRTARKSKSTLCHVFTENAAVGDSLGEDNLRGILMKHLDRGDIELVFEPALASSGLEPFHYEALARIKNDNGDLLPAQAFIPLAEQMGCISDLDKLVVKKVFEFMKAETTIDADLVVNLSPSSLLDESFVKWLLMTLARMPEFSKRLSFESPEHESVPLLKSLMPSVNMIIEAGCGFGFDHFGIGSAAFGYLISLKLSYLKIDGSYTRRFSENIDNQFFVKAIGNIAHSLDMMVIASCVERQQDLDVLRESGVDAVQGRLFSDLSNS